MNKKLTFRVALPAPLILVLAIVGATPAAAARGQMQMQMGGMMSMPPAAMVLQQMHMVNQFEIKAAELAKQKATKAPVKRYADRLRRDHHVADAKVTSLAQRLGFQLKNPEQMQQIMMQMKQMMRQSQMGSMGGKMPMQPMMQKMQMAMQKTQQTMMKLQSASGPKFDQAYITAMVKGHQQAVRMLEKVQAQKKLDQPKVMDLIEKLLPILKQHLKLAQHLQNRMTS